MRISDSRRVLFLHVPKTGGASIEVALDRNVPDIRAPYPRHSTLGEVLAREPEVGDYWIFGFVRNPCSRSHSSVSQCVPSSTPSAAPSPYIQIESGRV